MIFNSPFSKRIAKIAFFVIMAIAFRIKCPNFYIVLAFLAADSQIKLLKSVTLQLVFNNFRLYHIKFLNL